MKQIEVKLNYGVRNPKTREVFVSKHAQERFKERFHLGRKDIIDLFNTISFIKAKPQKKMDRLERLFKHGGDSELFFNKDYNLKVIVVNELIVLTCFKFKAS